MNYIFLLKILLVPILTVVSIMVGLFYKGIDRILTAKMQRRVGPPLLQPFFDVEKLMVKENIIPQDSLKWFFNLILFLIIALPVRYMIERVEPFKQNNRNPDWAIDLRKLNDRKITKGILLNYDKPIEAMFYTNLTAYSYIPDRNKITHLIAEGYTLIINDDGKLPDDIKTIKGITIERLNCR